MSGNMGGVLTFVLAVTSVSHIGAQTYDSCEEFPDYQAYIEQWKTSSPQLSVKLYPFGELYCDLSATGDQERAFGFDPRINFDVPYYGRTYKSLWVSPSGFIALSTGTTPAAVPFRWMDSWPNPQYPLAGQTDPPFIAPFYSEADLITKNLEPSRIFYRVLNPGGPTSVSFGMLEQISMEIQAAVLGAEDFEATHGLVVTWYRVTFKSNECSNCPRNTYQTAIVTDGVETYTVLSYYNMTWVGGGADQRCDPMTGRQSTPFPNCKPGHIGFNAGGAREFHALPYSGQSRIKDIDDEGGSDVIGRFYYRVSGEQVVRGGCTRDTSFGGATWPTEIFPKSGGMLGGAEVNISGPCFENADRIKCRFDDVVLDAIYINSLMKVTCVAPLMYKVGRVKVTVSVDGGSLFRTETDYIIVTQDHITPAISIDRENEDWLDPVQMELSWEPRMLTPRTSDQVNIRLYGYREEASSGEPQGAWKELHMLAAQYSNSGRFLLKTEDFMCNYNEEGQLCTSYDIGAFQIDVEYSTNDPNNPRRIWSSIFPLGWYIKDAMSQAEGSSWIERKCEVWYNENDDSMSWLDDLDPCPCTFEQAYIDFGRFQPDPVCRQESSLSTNCERHQGAQHCVLSTYAVSSTGSGNQCCYDNTGQLIYSGDDPYGSRPQRAHVWGAPPYKVPPKVPKMSHWVTDVCGLYYCCEWQTTDYECHSRYLSLRPTRSCEKYITPGQAMAYGDPHFRTFEGTFYTFNGYGEYWLMNVQQAEVHGNTINFKLHARMEQPPNPSWGQIKATYVTAVGMQQDEGPLVVLELSPDGTHKKILVHLDDYLLDLTEADLRRQEFDDVIIINNDEEDNNHSTNFTVVYRCGIGINVMHRNNLLDVVVSAPPEFKYKTRGLFGKWNDDPNDDLEPKVPGGPTFRPDETEKVHSLFGETWRVTSTESCFRYIYRSQMNHAYYSRTNFVPSYTPVFPSNNTEYTEGDVTAACSDDFACTYDFKTALNEDMAKQTRAVGEWGEQRQQMAQAVVSCGWLPVPYSIKSEPFSYMAGSQITLTGCVDGYALEGPTQYTCQSNGDGTAQWQPEVTSQCQGPDAPVETAKILAIAIPVALVAVLLIIGLVVLILVIQKRKKQRRQANESKQVYVPVFQEIIDWRDRTNQPGTATSLDEINVSKKKARKHSREGMADFMGGGVDAFGGSGPQPLGQKPPRPDISRSRESLDVLDSSGKNQRQTQRDYDNKGLNDTSSNTAVTSSGSSATGQHHVSWDTQDSENLAKAAGKPVKQSTLKSPKKKNKKKAEEAALQEADVSPIPSPKPPKKKRPYQYPSESKENLDNLHEPQPSPAANRARLPPTDPEVSTYRPRDLHSYTTGHNIPTSDDQTSSYYKRKYGRYNNTSFA